MTGRAVGPRVAALLVALAVARLFPAWWCGRDAQAWLRGDYATQVALAQELIAFEAQDDANEARAARPSDRFSGEWALVTHQMVALGLAQIALAHPDLRADYAPLVRRAAAKSFEPRMRDFGTKAWRGEDGLESLASEHGHAYLGYPALALSVARQLDPAFPSALAEQHDAVIAALERRLLASETGLIETYPGEAYPTDVAAVAAAIAVHGRATGKDHSVVLQRWAARVRDGQINLASGLVVQRMGARDRKAHDAPRGSGTGLAAYFAGFADRGVAQLLTQGLLKHESTLLGFSGIREYAAGHTGGGDVDSGPVVLGVSVAATGFALAPFRAHGHPDAFERIFRTTDLFGLPTSTPGSTRFAVGGPIGNALLLAFLTSGPELAP